ncbi:MAG: DUF523 domain-containing protein [Desulfobulbus oligotrophicus]|jgi:uncharacterized protein YbbK (DUF523 family)|nr:DUF523 domain-containing protein [Desulfobulbus oligotrophicus]
MKQMEKCLVSACLTGLCTRYDGQSKTHTGCLQLLAKYHWVPVCPEQLGGLSTPRPPANLINGDGHDVLAGICRVVDQHRVDRTDAFLRGAFMTLAIAQSQSIRLCFFKSGSPSCGYAPVIGVTAALLQSHGIQIISF